MMSANIDIITINHVFNMIINTGIYDKYYSIIEDLWMDHGTIFYDNLIKMIKRQSNIELMDIIALCECIINKSYININGDLYLTTVNNQDKNQIGLIKMEEFNYIKYSEYLKSIDYQTC